MLINLIRVQKYNDKKILSRFLELYFVEICGKNVCNLMILNLLHYDVFVLESA